MARPDRMPAARPAEVGLRWGWLFGAVWLVYLVDPLHAALTHRPGWARSLGAAAVVAFALACVTIFVRGRRRRLAGSSTPAWLPWTQAGVLLLLMVAMIPGAGQHALVALVFVAVTVMLSMPVRTAWTVVAVLALGAEAAVRFVPGWTMTDAGVGILLASSAVYALRLAFDRNRRLIETREELAQLAVSAERSRFARDLHDILGHSLTVITVKAELAGRLVEVDPARAAAELRDVQRLARDSLTDVRRAVSGIRDVTLAGELARARASLTSAGIDAELPVAVDSVPADMRELYGWVVREGVTNVLRHSGASHCDVRVDGAGIEVVDDGTGGAHPGMGGRGHGLAGLRERAEAVGATVSAAPLEEGWGFRLRLSVDPARHGPAPGAPASPATARAAGPDRAATPRSVPA